MEKTEVEEKIKNILYSVLKHDKFNNTNVDVLEELSWDSLSHIIIINEIEENFKIKFKLNELNKLKNLGSITEMVQLKSQNGRK